MSRARLLRAALAALPILGCGGSAANSIVVVTVTASPGVPTVSQLRVVVANGSLSDTKFFPPIPVTRGITFPASFAVTFATSRSGALSVAIDALDPSSRSVAQGENTATIVPGGRAEVVVNLDPTAGVDAGAPIPDAGGADAPGADVARADAATLAADVTPIEPDLRGTGGSGGGAGAGGATATGGVTTPPPTGTGGVTTLPSTGSGGVPATGGTTSLPTGGVTGAGGVGAGGTIATGGRTTTAGGSGGTMPAGGGGVIGTGGIPGAGGTPGSDAGTEPCTPNKTITGSGSGNSGTFGTTGPYCFRTPDTIIGWNCTNFTGRTIKVNGVTETCGAMPLPAKVNGYYYFDASGGTGAVDYASIYWY
jgi:hypothetical protein